MSQVKFRSYLKDFERKLVKEEKKKVTEATIAVQGAAKKKLRRTGSGRVYQKYKPRRTHQASKPGQPPAEDTGRLLGSVARDVNNKGGEWVGRVGTDLKYGKRLERGTTTIKKRPWLQPTFNETEKEVRKIFLKEIK